MKLVLSVIFLFFINAGFAQLKFLNTFPFKIGEKMTLSISVLGVYVGDQKITIDEYTNYLGLKVLKGSGQLTTTPFISSMYKVDDREMTYFLPDGFIPYYYERWINEGSWHDNIIFRFYPGQRTVVISQKVNNYDKKEVNYTGTLRNYFTLISCMRSVDYDYHISNKINVEIDFLFGTNIKKAVFKPSYNKLKYKDKMVDTIVLEEVGGIGMNFYILNSPSRMPIRLVIPAFEVIGFKTISIYVEMKEYIEGNKDFTGFFAETSETNEETAANTNIITNTMVNYSTNASANPVTNLITNSVVFPGTNSFTNIQTNSMITNQKQGKKK
jgi:hypothetical protein